MRIFACQRAPNRLICDNKRFAFLCRLGNELGRLQEPRGWFRRAPGNLARYKSAAVKGAIAHLDNAGIPLDLDLG
jgi:hypothetical protein